MKYSIVKPQELLVGDVVEVVWAGWETVERIECKPSGRVEVWLVNWRDSVIFTEPVKVRRKGGS